MEQSIQMSSGDVENLGALGGGVIMVVWAAFTLLVLVSMWRVFAKAGKPGWACLVPIYNLLVLIDIAGKPTWQVVLFFVPIANIFALFSVSIGLAQRFGKGTGFGIGLALLGFIFYPALAFSSAEYQARPIPAQGAANSMPRAA